MPGVATETHPIQTGYACSQFYGPGHHLRLFAPISHTYCVNGGHDVTDNKTNESVPLYNLKTFYTMNDIFHREDERLKTFDNWPLEWMDKFQLAQTGMFFTGEGDKVKCYFCEVEIGRWERDDQPVPEHLRWSPNCPLLRRRTTNNVPISAEALDRILPPVSYDICGANDAIEVRPNAYAEGTIAAPRMMTSTAVNTGPNSGSAGMAANNCNQPGCSPNNTTYFPEYPEYAIEAARVRSFAEWPRHMKQKPLQLAEAGFFYTGVGDRVKCFSCGGGLKDWDDSDEPWEQHALWLNRCRFLKLIKGQNYIDAIIAKQKAKEAGEDEKSIDTTAINEAAAHKSAAVNTPAFLSSNCDVAPQTLTAMGVGSSSEQQLLVGNTKCTATATATATAAAACRFASVEMSNIANATTTTANATATYERKPQSSIPEEKLCKICYAGEYNTAFLPCGHVVACAKCASSVTKCPLCRKPFTDVMRVYFS